MLPMASAAFNPLMHPPRKRAVVAVTVIFLIIAASGVLSLIVAADADFPMFIRVLAGMGFLMGLGLPAYIAATVIHRRITRGRWLRSHEEWRADAVRREQSRLACAMDQAVRWIMPVFTVITVTGLILVLLR